jgi:aryl-alcohol dehydrogenase-like predicted oxidoreductase
MRTVELGRTGEQVSALALGAMGMGTSTPEDESLRMLDRYVDTGGSFVDTADCYGWFMKPGARGGESEELLGRWMASRGNRDRLFISTKGSGMPRDTSILWRDGQADWETARATFAGAGARTLRAALDGSLRRLGTDRVDLYYVHVDDRSTPLEETCEALAGMVAAGKVRHIGWSNVATWRLERIRQLCDRNGWPAPVALQQQHSYLRPRAGLDSVSIVDPAQLDYLREHDDLTLVAYSPILKGIYDDPAKRAGHWAMEPYAGPDAEARLAVVAEVAAEVGVPPNQLVVAWLLHQTRPRVVPLVGPRTYAQLEAALPALDVKLTAAQLDRLDAAGA